MKKILLVLAVLFTVATQAQTLILTDTIYSQSDTIYLKWHHVDFNDSDKPFVMKTKISLEKILNSDTVRIRPNRLKFVKNQLIKGDSLKNPYGNNYFSYQFVKDYIYSTNEDMKRTLSLYFLLNEQKRLLE
jgi:hypothetical protein